MSRTISLVMLAVVVSACPSRAQFGGMGMATAGLAVNEPARPYRVEITTEQGATLLGTMSFSRIQISTELALYSLKPEKVEEIRFEGAGDGGAGGMPPGFAGGGFGLPTFRVAVQTTSGEEFVGMLIHQGSFPLETDLGTVAVHAQKLKAIALKGAAEAAEPAAESEPSAPAAGHPSGIRTEYTTVSVDQHGLGAQLEALAAEGWEIVDVEPSELNTADTGRSKIDWYLIVARRRALAPGS